MLTQNLQAQMRSHLSKTVRGVLRFDEPLGPHTTFGIGGPADAWVEPRDAEDLREVLSFCREEGIPWHVFGKGTNLLIRDGGLRGLVLRLAHPSFRGISVDGRRVTVGAGLGNMRLLEFLKGAEFSGAEFVCGIPGCSGGGVVMNAGAHGRSWGDIVREVLVLTRGETRWMGRDDLEFSYRHCHGLRDAVVLEVCIDLARGQRENIEGEIHRLLGIRNATQPKGSSPGCVFKNPEGRSAGALIDKAGLKGMRLRGAWIAQEHGNFFMNDRSAKSADVLALIRIARQRVQEQTGISLETEIKILGEE